MVVLSLFPGLGLLDHAFADCGFCVVRGPDPLWGGDIHDFHPPAGAFDGIVGGPPCQSFSDLKRLFTAAGFQTRGVDLVPEFVRCVEESQPRWFVMENVTRATEPSPSGYSVSKKIIHDWKAGGRTRRKRAFWFGHRGPALIWPVDQKHWPAGKIERTITRNARVPDESHHRRAAERGGGVLPGDGRYMPIQDVLKLQGLPEDWTEPMPFRLDALRIMLGNGVPQAMGRAVAQAVKDTIYGKETNRTSQDDGPTEKAG